MEKSRIPQFILDTRHPWLEEPPAWLNEIEDLDHALGSLESEIRPGNGGSNTYPIDLFKKLEINNNRYGVDRKGWGNAMARMGEMLQSPAALHDVEEFCVEIYILDARFNAKLAEPHDPYPEVPALFTRVLSSMPNLRKLEWNTAGYGNEVLEKAFLEANITIPSMKTLRVDPAMRSLVGMCPNLEVLEEGGRNWNMWFHGGRKNFMFDFIESAANAKNLTRFSLDGKWEATHIEVIQRLMPNLTDLVIQGSIGSNGHDLIELSPPPSPLFDGVFENSTTRTLEVLAKVLGKMSNLKKLTLPNSSRLGLGFNGGPKCGNAFFGKGGRNYGRSISATDARTTEEAGNIVLPHLPRLESLEIGSYCATIKKDEDGNSYIVWPWTDRMEAWTYEIWPEPKSGEPDDDM